MISIMSAQSGEPLEQFMTLAREYITWMIAEIQLHYPELDIATFRSEHQYDDVQRKFPGEHVPPDGCLLIAIDDNAPAGCIALGRLGNTVCEVRTLFVRPAIRGKGIGRELVRAALREAQKLHYQQVRLDTLGFMQGAIELYNSFGFHAIEPYLDLPDSMRQYIHFLELDLTKRDDGASGNFPL